MLAFSNDYYGMIFRATQSVELFCAYFIRLFTDPNNISNIISFISLVFSAIQTKIMIDQHLESKQTKNLESKQIEEYQKLLREKNIIINNLIINNNGNIQINNTINNE